MALDGIVVASLAKELQENFTNARLSKIAQPEKDELLLTLKGPNGQKRLLLSASASLPLVYITGTNKPSPMTAPNFCMLLRKHVANGRITSITQDVYKRQCQNSILVADDLLIAFDLIRRFHAQLCQQFLKFFFIYNDFGI